MVPVGTPPADRAVRRSLPLRGALRRTARQASRQPGLRVRKSPSQAALFVVILPGMESATSECDVHAEPCASRSPQGTPLNVFLRRVFPAYLATGGNVSRIARCEFEAYSQCGDPAFGCATMTCKKCGFTRTFPLACKRRGWCPSCLTYRMHKGAAHLTDNVIGDTPVRHWILILPPELRYNIGINLKLLSAALKCFISAIFHYQKIKARTILELESTESVHPGAISVTHRFSCSLDPNYHFHIIVCDGVFVELADHPARFVRLPAPTAKEIQTVAWNVCCKVLRELTKREFWKQSTTNVRPGVARGKLSFGKVKTAIFRGAAVSSENGDVDDEADVVGSTFSVYVGRPVETRSRLLHLLEYVLSPPLTDDQIRITPDDQVVIRLERPRQNGDTHITMSSTAFLKKLIFLIPPRKTKTYRQHGVFAPNARLRKLVVARPTHRVPPISVLEDGCERSPDQEAQRYVRVRTHPKDTRSCPNCQKRLHVVVLVSHKLRYRDPRWIPPDIPDPTPAGPVN